MEGENGEVGGEHTIIVPSSAYFTHGSSFTKQRGETELKLIDP